MGTSGKPLGYGEGRIRTGDTAVFSRVLYHLSYLAAPVKCSRCAARDPSASELLSNQVDQFPWRSRTAGWILGAVMDPNVRARLGAEVRHRRLPARI